MSISTRYMPDILRANKRANSISVLRALKHIKDVLETENPSDDHWCVAMSDLEQMIQAVASGRDLEALSI